MAVTNYISMDGMLMGEMTSGVMRNYGTDALGSVVETVLNGVEENTYQYKPYGGLLAKTGAAADPSYLWNGGSGYRATNLTNSDFYVRHRHYSMSSGLWTTSDPLWPDELSYNYARGRVGNLGDPTGLAVKLQTTIWDQSPKTGRCYGSITPFVTAQWWLKGLTDRVNSKGFIVQILTSTMIETDCQGPVGSPQVATIWEAWQVDAPHIYQGYKPNVWSKKDPEGKDRWQSGAPSKEIVAITFSATAYYFSPLSVTWPDAGGLPSMSNKSGVPPFWNDTTTRISNPVTRTWTVMLNCCKDLGNIWSMKYTPSG